MDTAFISGVGMTPFAKYEDTGLKELSALAINDALDDGGVDMADVQAVYFGNALGGLTTGQECIRGQTVLHAMGHGTIPVVNVENACASGGTALHLAWSAVSGGQYDTVLAVGAEKMYFPGDRRRAFVALNGALDVERPHSAEDGAGDNRSIFMDLYAQRGRNLMSERGVTREGLARLAVKARANGALNPRAQYRTPVTIEQVLSSRAIVDPLTLFMCAPIGDGAAAAIVTRVARPDAVEIRASQLRTLAAGDDGPPGASVAASAAYEQAGLGPADVDVAEVHDATTAGEIVAWTHTGLCVPGDEENWAQTGHTELGGALPVNPSGGLVARGHPVGASGLAQVHELVNQLRRRAGPRQVPGASVAFAHVAGGAIGTQTATAAVHMLVRR